MCELFILIWFLWYFVILLWYNYAGTCFFPQAWFPEKTSRPSCVCVCVCAVCHMSDLRVCPEAMMERLFLSMLFRLPGRRAAPSPRPSLRLGFSWTALSDPNNHHGRRSRFWLVGSPTCWWTRCCLESWQNDVLTICLLFLRGSPHFSLLPLILCFSVTGECCCDWQKQNPVFRKQPRMRWCCFWTVCLCLQQFHWRHLSLWQPERWAGPGSNGLHWRYSLLFLWMLPTRNVTKKQVVPWNQELIVCFGKLRVVKQFGPVTMQVQIWEHDDR